MTLKSVDTLLDGVDVIIQAAATTSGAKDIVVPPGNASLMKDRIRDAELFMIPEAGHNYPAADPVGIHERITGWLRN